MKALFEKWIRKRNPRFRFAPEVDGRLLRAFAWTQVWCLLRGCRLLLFGRAPHWMMRGRGVRMFCLRRIRWGNYLKLGDYVYISALGREGVRFGNNVGIGAFSRIVVATSLNDPGNFIRIGNNVGIGEFAYLGGAGGLEIGDDCIVGQYLSCHPENHQFGLPDTPIRLQGVIRQGIKIGANCWIGSKVTILDGVEIGEGCVIAAGAVVNRSMPPNSIVGGVPARLIRSRILSPAEAVQSSHSPKSTGI